MALHAFVGGTPCGTRGVLLAPSTDLVFKCLRDIPAYGQARVVGRTGFPRMETPVSILASGSLSIRVVDSQAQLG